MPAPTAYTEATLATYMVGVLSSVAGSLSLTTSSAAILSAITSVERILSVSDVAGLTDMAKLETIATWKAWQAAADSAADAVDLRAGSASISRSQLFDHISKRLASAEGAALVYAEVQAASGAGGVAIVTGLSGVSNPYGWATCRDF